MLKRMEKRWDEAIRRYANRHLPQVVAGEGPNVSVNLLLSNVRTKLPFLFYRDPELLVRPRHPNAPHDQAALVKGLVSYYLKEQKARNKINRCILDGLLQSRGILKVGYSTRTTSSAPQPKKGGDPTAPFFGKKRKRGRPRKESSAVDQMPPLRVLQEGPTLTHVSPRRFLTHPDAKFPLDEHARWVCHMSVKPIDLVRLDERFDLDWRKKVKPTETLKEPSTLASAEKILGDSKSEDPQNQFVVLYEVWEKTRREVMTFADGNFSLGPARVVRWPFTGMPGFPFALYVPLEIPETFEAMTELDPIINQIEEMDHFRTMQARHLERFKRFYEVTSDTIDHDELDKLRQREDGDYVITNAEDGRRSIWPVADAEIPVDAFRFIGDVRNDIDVVSGVSELRRSGQSTGGTATEASIVDQVQQARGVFDRQVVDDFVLDAIEKKFKVMQQWLPENKAIEIYGPLGRDWVENVSPSMIEGEYDFEILAGSTSPPNIQLMRAEVMQLVQAVQAPVFQNSVDFHEVLRLLLETFPELVRAGRLEQILRAPEALPSGGNGMGPPGMGGPGLEGVSPEVQQLIAQSGGGLG